MKCSNCGFNNQPGAKFCAGQCGGSSLSATTFGQAQMDDYLARLNSSLINPEAAELRQSEMCVTFE